MNKEDINKIVQESLDTIDISKVMDYDVQNDHCIVAPVDFKSETPDPSGLYSPSQYEDKREYGVILATGPGRRADFADLRLEPGFKVGDTVLYGRYSYFQMRVNGFDLNLIRHDDIIAVLPSRTGE